MLEPRLASGQAVMSWRWMMLGVGAVRMDPEVVGGGGHVFYATMNHEHL